MVTKKECYDLCNEISSLRCDHLLNDSVIIFTSSSRPNHEEKPLRALYIPYTNDVWEKLNRGGNLCNTRMISKPENILRSAFMKTRPQRGPSHMVQCVYSILYVAKDTGRPLAGRLHERGKPQKGSPRKVKLVYVGLCIDLLVFFSRYFLWYVNLCVVFLYCHCPG
jgi:hypothetical protein